jgi:hypothetical protein
MHKTTAIMTCDQDHVYAGHVAWSGGQNGELLQHREHGIHRRPRRLESKNDQICNTNDVTGGADI